MADDTRDIREFYDASADKEDGRLERHQLERDMTWRYLDKYLPRRGKILEIGAATGAYTIPLAKRGYAVTAVDFAPNLLEVCRRKAAAEKLADRVTCLAADVRDLAAVTGGDFDAALVMGPLYHLVEETDRLAALNEVRRKLKKGAVIFSTFVSRYGVWGDIVARFPHEIEWEGWLESVIKRGKQDVPMEDRGKAFRAYFAAPEEIRPLHEKAGFTALALAGLEVGGIPDASYNALKGKQREQWMDFLFSIGSQPSIIGAACHLIYVGVKA